MRKTTTEECLTIDIGIFRKMKSGFSKTRRGVLHFRGGRGGQNSLGYCLRRELQGPIVTLSYSMGRESIEIPIPLVTTRTQFEGLRWWFRCPLCVNGKPCHRRAGKIYLPPGARLFGCRECHRLAYRSSQEAHWMERLAARLGPPISDSCTAEVVKRLLQVEGH